MDAPPELADAMRDPRRRLGPYVLLEELGRGGMGVVYRAYDPRMGRTVAVKRILRGLLLQELRGEPPDPRSRRRLRASWKPGELASARERAQVGSFLGAWALREPAWLFREDLELQHAYLRALMQVRAYGIALRECERVARVHPGDREVRRMAKRAEEKMRGASRR